MEDNSKPDYQDLPENESARVSYGNRFFSIILVDGSQINLYADRVTVSPNGDLIAHGDEKQAHAFGVTAGRWLYFWAASVFDGRPICVDKAWGWSPCKPR